MTAKTNKGKIEATPSSIDKDVLDIMSQEDILKAISDDKQLWRLLLNYFAEMLSTIKELAKAQDEFNQMISICSADKMQNFFKELQENVAEEEKRQNLMEKIGESHKKSKKSKKI